jgi:arylsulfatase A-like enzyme
VLTALDSAIGRVLQHVDQLGIADNTIVILLSDNGAFMIPGRGLECASNKPLKGGGTMLYEGGVRVPCIVRWPGHIQPGSTTSEPLSSMDFAPLALSVAGVKADRELDGRDPTAALTGAGPSLHKSLYFRYGSMHAIRSGKWKAIKPSGSRPWSLYDLSTDIGESADRTSEHPEIARTLIDEYDNWRASMPHKD